MEESRQAELKAGTGDAAGRRGWVAGSCDEEAVADLLAFTHPLVGASIGSVPPHVGHNCVRNITFRNVTMPGTTKGIYIQSNPR